MKALIKTIFVGAALLVGATVWAQTYKVALMELPAIEVFKQLTVAAAQESGANVDIQVVPPARALGMLMSKSVDIECPQLVTHNPDRLKTLPFDYSTDVLFDIAFVLYENKAKPVDIASLKAGNPKGYVIETDLSNLTSFEFKCMPSTNLEASLKKVDKGVIDGLIYAQPGTDPILKQMGLKNIKRELYDTFQMVFAVQKGSRGGPADRMLSVGLKKLRANGTFDKLMAQEIAHAKYVDWQP